MKKRRILMLEDDPDDRYITNKYFIDNGYDIEVNYFPSGKADVIEYLTNLESSNRPNLILMSGKFGPDQLVALKKHPRFRQIPIVVLIEVSHSLSTDEAYKLGANSVIEKPFTHKLTSDKINCFIQYWFTTVELPQVIVSDQV